MYRPKLVMTLSLAAALLQGSVASAGMQESKWRVPSSAMGVAVVRPADAIQQPGMEMIPRELITVMGQRELGFDPCRIVRATGIVQAPQTLEGPPPGFALVLEFDSPQQPGEALVGRLQKSEVDGMTIYSGAGPMEPSLLQLDAKTIIVGNENFIGEMLAPKGPDSTLLRLMASQPSSGHLAAWMTIEPVRGLIRENLPPADQIPFPFQDFLQLPELIDNFSVSIDLSGSDPHRFQIGTVDDAAAKKTWSIMQSGISVGRTLVMAQMMAQMQDEESDMQQAMQQYFNRLADHFQEQLKPDIRDRFLVFEAASGDQTMSIATIGVLTGLLLPAVQQVREAARRTQSMNNLKQILLAMHNYDSVYKKMPAQAIRSKDNKPLLSWRVQILPYLDEQALYDQFHLDESWDSPHNIRLLDQMPAVYQNPNLPAGNETVYLTFTGPKTAHVDGVAPKLRDIRDGMSNTICVVEAADSHAVPWTKPADIEFNSNDPHAGLESVRPGGFIAGMFDGSVQMIENSIDAETLRNMIMPADGNIIRGR